jgi:hypothetical protein
MTTTDLENIVDEYLRRLDAALGDLPGPRRQQLMGEIAEHLEEARSELPIESEAALRELLDRVGKPEEIAAEALADMPEQGGRRPNRGLTVALAGLVILAVLGVILGLAVSGGSRNPGANPPPITQTKPFFVLPNVIGLPSAQATAVLKSLGTRTSLATVSSDGHPAGAVISQSPGAGSRVTRGSLVTLSVAPPPTTAPSTAPVAPLIPNGIYTGGSPGTPHYFVSLTNGSSGGIAGSVNFLYQDGQTSVVFTFDGTVQAGVATLHPTAVPQGGGSASQAPATIPSSLSATLNRNSVSLGECTSYLHFAQSLAQCNFTYAAGGTP